jgi:hypothetical protein
MLRDLVPGHYPAREKVTWLPAPGRARQFDHFSERIEPASLFSDTKSTAGADFDKKGENFREQNRVVAAPSQFDTSFARAPAAKQPN